MFLNLKTLINVFIFSGAINVFIFSGAINVFIFSEAINVFLEAINVSKNFKSN